LPVVNQQKQVVGLITDNDLQRSGLKINLSLLRKMTPAERQARLATLQTTATRSVMTQPVITVGQSDSLATAIQLIYANQLKRLPVVDQAGQLIGMVTRSDILREIAFADAARLVNQKQFFDWAANIRTIELEPVTLLPATMLLAVAIERLQAQGQKRAVVTDEAGKVVGIITESDLWSRVHQPAHSAAAADVDAPPQQELSASSACLATIMTTPVITVQQDSRACDAIRLLILHQIKRLPVLDPTGRVLGLVGRAGLFNRLLTDTVTAISK